MEEIEKKWLKALAKTHSKHAQEVRRLHKIINANVEIIKMRKEGAKKCNQFIDKLIEQNRVSKEELRRYFTKKEKI